MRYPLLIMDLIMIFLCCQYSIDNRIIIGFIFATVLTLVGSLLFD